MKREVSVLTPVIADRRWGCRGSEMAINTLRRKTPCC
jgi:hypothetical protein